MLEVIQHPDYFSLRLVEHPELAHQRKDNDVISTMIEIGDVVAPDDDFDAVSVRFPLADLPKVKRLLPVP